PWDQYWTQKEIFLSAQDEIDLYWDGLADLATFVNKHQARPLDDLIANYAPDMLEVIPMSWLQGGVVNGEIYGLPSAYGPSSAQFQLVCVRRDLLEGVGMTGIANPDDLVEFATKVKEQYPEMKGPADVIFKPLTRAFQDEQLTWVSGNEIAVLGEESGKVYSYYETETFQKVAKFNQNMFDTGLYNDLLSTNYNERDSRMQTGLYLWVEGSLGKDTEIIGTVKANAPEAQLKTYLMAAEDDKYISTAGGEVLCIPYSAANPEGAMMFLNWLYSSQENYLFAIYGVEGKDYEMVDGRINRITTEDFFYEWMFRNQNYSVFGADVSQEYIDAYMSWDANAKTSKAMGFVFNNENVVEIETAILEVIQSYMSVIRNGFVNFDENYPAAVQMLKDAGIDEYIAEVQRQLDEFVAQNQG
ncbi:MAG: ABC transporter substrate-binding protein, partial [Oscillospiraceae bacterium]|nr:ABC transporter substrate-binding protein [Oscillospiraceae bacterium]